MLPKLHKSEFLNSTLGGSEYLHLTDFDQKIEGRPIVGGPCYFTSGLSEMVDIILKPIVLLLPQILRDSFDLLERTDSTVVGHVLLGSCDIKSLYTNISKDLALKSIDYWISEYGDSVPTFQRFSKVFVLNALAIILDFNYFMFNDIYVKQIKGFAMGTKAAVNCANLTVGFLELRMFSLLPTVYPQDVVDFIIRNYFRFLDDIMYQWLADFDITHFYEIFENLDPDLNFIFSNLSSEENFLDINFKIVNNVLVMNLYHKPTDSHNYLNYNSSHPQHTRDNIALSLAKRIVRIVSENRDSCLETLKQQLIMRDHPVESINYAFSKVFQPKRQPSDNNNIVVFTSTYNPKHRYDKRVIKNITRNITSGVMREVFGETKIIMGTRQPPALRDMLTSSKFSLKPIKRKKIGLFFCGRKCMYHRAGYVRQCKSFRFGEKNQFEWVYNRFFDCDSRNVIYLLQCSKCWMFYIGETEDLKVRTRAQKSNANHPDNSN